MPLQPQQGDRMKDVYRGFVLNADATCVVCLAVPYRLSSKPVHCAQVSVGLTCTWYVVVLCPCVAFDQAAYTNLLINALIQRKMRLPKSQLQ